VACKDAFSNPWDLMVHVQAAHMVNIYEIGDFDGDSVSNKGSNGSSRSSKLDKTNGESLSNGASSCNGSVVHPNENVSLFCSLEYFSIIMKNSYKKKIIRELGIVWRFLCSLHLCGGGERSENEEKSSLDDIIVRYFAWQHNVDNEAI